MLPATVVYAATPVAPSAITPLLEVLEPALANTPVPPELVEVAVIGPAPRLPSTVALLRITAVPLTSRVAPGDVVAMPTLPDEPSKIFEFPSLVGLSHFVIWFAVPVPEMAAAGAFELAADATPGAAALTNAEGGRPPTVSASSAFNA